MTSALHPGEPFSVDSAVCVIGSGPSGVACAAALLGQGRAVRMLDAGTPLDAERALRVQRLGQLPPETWSFEEKKWLTEGMDQAAGELRQKLVFGSDFPYQGDAEHLGAVYEGVAMRASLALGGLSTVWGAAMLPSRECDIEDWPISRKELEPHYKAVVNLTGLSAEQDDLAEFFPVFAESPGHLEPSRQTATLLKSMQRHRGALRSAGIHFGCARVAIRVARGPAEPGCLYCGMCMYGCPYGHIYSAADTVQQLRQFGRFRYEPDCVVDTVRETTERVIVTGHHRVTSTSFELSSPRVYVAAGAVPTTGILLRSLGLHDRTVRMKDSQYFLLLPLALGRRVGNVRSERLHALSQAFVEICDPRISRHTVHLQVYSFSDVIGKVVRKSLGPLARPLDVFAREMENHLLLVQGFLHSAHSSGIAVTLRNTGNAPRGTLELKAVPNPEAKRITSRVVRKLLKHTFRLGALPLPMLMQFAKPGRSFHCGGTFPMRANPSGLEADTLGRPAGWQRVHAVDATIFPSIPATTITFTIMANAHRIGSETAKLI